VYRIESVHVCIKGIQARTAEEAAHLAWSIDLRPIIDEDRVQRAGGFEIDSVRLADDSPGSFQIDPLDVDGEPRFRDMLILAEDREARLYRLPPSHNTYADDSINLVEQLSQMDVDELPRDDKLRLLVEDAQLVVARHSASGRK
jgi:hypothetical protein